MKVVRDKKVPGSVGLFSQAFMPVDTLRDGIIREPNLQHYLHGIADEGLIVEQYDPRRLRPLEKRDAADFSLTRATPVGLA